MNVAISNFQTKVLRVTPVCDTSAYTAGDVLFETTALPIDGRGNGAKGTIRFAGILDKDDQASQTITLWFLRSNVALGTKNSAPSITDTNAEEIIGKVTVTTSDDLGGCKQGQAEGIALPFELPAGGTALYVAATTAGTPTQTASGIFLRIGLEIESHI